MTRPKVSRFTRGSCWVSIVLIMQKGDPAKAMVIHKASGKAEKELLLEVRRPEKEHGQFRHIRMTKTSAQANTSVLLSACSILITLFYSTKTLVIHVTYRVY